MSVAQWLSLLAVLRAASALAGPSDMRDRLPVTGEGNTNPNYNQRIKSIMIFQADGWEGLMSEPVPSDPTKSNPTWPLHFGRQGYLTRNHDVFLWQLHEIKALGGRTAIAQLILPDVEANASGKGGCWNGNYTGSRTCSSGGVWRFPTQLTADLRWAAWMKGVQIAPHFSINNYEWPQDQRASHAADAMQKLKNLTAWYKQNFPVDAVTLLTTSGKMVILTEGLPENTGLPNNAQARQDLCDYMKSQTDVFWIDNLLITNASACDSINVFRSAVTTDERAQDTLLTDWGSRYLYAYLDRWGTRTSHVMPGKNLIPLPTQLKWLNISPFRPDAYPVIISQWNEYGEFHVFEPSELDDYNEFNSLMGLLAQQPN